MSPKRCAKIWLSLVLACGSLLLACGLATGAHAADDTARFYGTWQTVTLVNGQMVTIVTVHDASGVKNYVRLPTGDVPAGEGTFSAANGKWNSNAPAPNNVGVYHFLSNDIVVATNAAGLVVTWKREKEVSSGPVDANTAARRTTGYIPPSGRPGNSTEPPAPSTPPPSPTPNPQPAQASDASLSPGMTTGMQALQRRDYNTAWREFMAEAQKGSADGEAAVGSMLFQKTNPPGTGFYAQCEKWLLASANQGNEHGMDMLAQYYFNEGKNIAGGINPGVNSSPIPPQLQAQAEGKFKLSRQWFEKSAAKGDIYAMGNLAVMLDSGVGGPRDPARAEQLRAQVKAGPDAGFAHRATADPGNLARSALWQSGHYAEAVKNAEAGAAKGDANSEALLGRAYYEGLGVPRNFGTAQMWLSKAVAQNNADATFFLGLMYEYGRGVPPDVKKALALFDKGAELGNRNAQMEAKGMRMEGVAAEQQARFAAVCHAAGGVADGPLCLSGGMEIDPY